MDQSDRYPKISQAIRLLVLLLFLGIVFFTLIGILSSVVDYPPLIDHPVSLAIVSLIATGVILRRGFKKTKASFREVFPLGSMRLSLLFPMVLTVIGTGILLSEMDNMLRTILPMPTWLADSLMRLMAGQTSLWGSLVLVVIVAPLNEELLFRGLILRGFLSHYTVRKAVLASAILFGVFHFNPWQFLTATLLGILFAWWFLQTRSLLPCLFGHALSNAVLLILMSGHIEIQGFTGDLTGPIEFQPLWLDAIGLLLVGLGIGLLSRMLGKADNLPAEDSLGTQL